MTSWITVFPSKHRQPQPSYKLIFLGFKPMIRLPMLVLLKRWSMFSWFLCWKMFWHSSSCLQEKRLGIQVWVLSDGFQLQLEKNQQRFCHYWGIEPGFLTRASLNLIFLGEHYLIKFFGEMAAFFLAAKAPYMLPKVSQLRLSRVHCPGPSFLTGTVRCCSLLWLNFGSFWKKGFY